jgi:hypothetical protein
MEFAKITTDDGASHLVRIIEEGPRIILAWIVDREGGATEKQWLISTERITKRIPYEQNFKYGTLERNQP